MRRGGGGGKRKGREKGERRVEREGKGEGGGGNQARTLCFSLLLFPVGGWRCLPPPLLASAWTGAGAGTLTTSRGVVGLLQLLPRALPSSMCCEASIVVSQTSIS